MFHVSLLDILIIILQLNSLAVSLLLLCSLSIVLAVSLDIRRSGPDFQLKCFMI